MEKSKSAIETKVAAHMARVQQRILDQVTDSKVRGIVREEFKEAFHVEEADLANKRKRKPLPDDDDRCTANRANDSQCLRVRKPDSNFCGTHQTQQPHGTVESNKGKKLEVIAVDIDGIHCWVDPKGNVYKTEDVKLNKKNPLVVGQCRLVDGRYKHVD
jgi:hypothetical protein